MLSEAKHLRRVPLPSMVGPRFLTSLRCVRNDISRLLEKESTEGQRPFDGGLGVSPRFLFLPLSLAKGEGDTGGEGLPNSF